MPEEELDKQKDRWLRSAFRWGAYAWMLMGLSMLGTLKQEEDLFFVFIAFVLPLAGIPLAALGILCSGRSAFTEGLVPPKWLLPLTVSGAYIGLWGWLLWLRLQ